MVFLFRSSFWPTFLVDQVWQLNQRDEQIFQDSGERQHAEGFSLLRETGNTSPMMFDAIVDHRNKKPRSELMSVVDDCVVI